MGNVVLWKPSDNQIYTAKITMDIFKEAGLPDEFINLVTGDPEVSDIVETSDFQDYILLDHISFQRFMEKNWK